MNQEERREEKRERTKIHEASKYTCRNSMQGIRYSRPICTNVLCDHSSGHSTRVKDVVNSISNPKEKKQLQVQLQQVLQQLQLLLQQQSPKPTKAGIFF